MIISYTDGKYVIIKDMVNYRKIKRFFAKRWQYVVILILGLIVSVGVWGQMDPIMTGDDYAFHMTRLMGASRAWSNGQIVPQVDPDALGGFGYAYNIFYGPLVTYATALLQVIVGSWPVTISLVLVLCVILAGVLMCRTMMKISKNSVLSTIVAAIYLASPYFLNNLYRRMALGEVLAFIAVSILILGLFRLTKHEKWAARDIAVAATLLLLSHSLSALLFALMAGLYILFNLKKLVDWDNLWRMFLGAVVALGLTAFFTLPLVEAKMTGIYGVFDQGYSEVYFGANPKSVNDHRFKPSELIVTNRNSNQELSGESGLALGLIVWIGLLGFWFVRKRIENKDERRLVTSFWVISVLAILAALPLINWYYMPGIMWQIQFPWRFLMITAAAMSLVSGYTIYSLIAGLAEEKQKLVAVMVGLGAIYLVLPVIAVKPGASLEDLAKDPVSVGWEAEYAPMQLLCSPDVKEDVDQGFACSLSRIQERLEERGKDVKVLSGKAKLVDVKRDGLNFELRVENRSENDLTLEFPVIYYPGYQAELNDNALSVRASEEYGLAQVVIAAGESGELKLWYGLSKATRIGLMISGGTAVLSLIWLIISRLKDLHSRKKDAEMETLMDSVREVVEEDIVEEDDGVREVTDDESKKELRAALGEAAKEGVDADGDEAPAAEEKPRITKVKAKSTPKKEKKA